MRVCTEAVNVTPQTDCSREGVGVDVHVHRITKWVNLHLPAIDTPLTSSVAAVG